MKIVFDARMLSWTGIGRITKRLLEQYQQLDHDNHYVVMLLSQDYEKWHPTAPNFTKIKVDYAPYSWQEQVLMPIKLYMLRPDLVHFLHFNAPLAYFGRYVVTINDLTLLESKNSPSSLPGIIKYELKDRVMRLILRHSIAISRHIITISRHVKDQILHRYSYTVDADKITVTYPASEILDVQPGSIKELGIKGNFLLYVGNPYPHKNLARLIQAFDHIAGRRPDLYLVIVSNLSVGNTREFYGQLMQRAGSMKAGARILFPSAKGFINDAQLAALYKQADLFVFPSLSEGFGMPPLEAMQYGTPVISSNASCMPEICGDAAAYFDPTSPTDMAEKIDALLSDQKELLRLRKAGPEHIKRFSWEKMAKQTLGVYRKASS